MTDDKTSLAIRIAAEWAAVPGRQWARTPPNCWPAWVIVGAKRPTASI